MDSFAVNIYKDMLLSIKQGKSVCGKSKAKPYFLLSMIECIALGKQTVNKIRWDNSELIKTYDSIFRYYKDEHFVPLLVPYFHLSSSSFYHLVCKEGITPQKHNRTPSQSFLRANLLYAKLDDELWGLLQTGGNREFFKRCIINRFIKENK